MADKNKFAVWSKGSAFLFILILAGFLNLRFGVDKHAGTQNGEEIETGERLPQSLAATSIALGPLRGLIANILWWRIIEQQDAGNYFEIIQLSDWITVLQPENPRVWTYQAWNMAYNVAYEFPDGESKWKWIFAAYKLLALDALKILPSSYEIKRETARIFADRIGSSIDPGAPFFKKKWAVTIMKYLPEGSRSEIARLAAEPRDFSEYRKIQDFSQFLEECSKISFDPSNSKIFYSPQDWTEMQRRFLDDPNSRKLMARLDSFHKASEIRAELGLEPSRMLEIDESFGPFDWRLWQAFSVYFAARGNFAEFLKEPPDRHPLLRQALISSFLDGKLICDPKQGVFLTAPNFRISGKLHDYYDYMMLHHFSPRIDALHRDFLERAMAILYTYNQKEAAEHMFEHYVEGGYPGSENIDFESFLVKSLYKTLHNTSTMTRKAMVESSLVQAYNWLATGEVQRAVGYANFARLLWKDNQLRAQGNPAKMLPPLEDMMRSALKQVMESPIAPEYKARLQIQLELKEFEMPDEKAETGDMHKEYDTYKNQDSGASGDIIRLEEDTVEE